jgi:hypothetical protein
MKKILLSLVIFASAGMVYQSYGQAQLCGAGNIIHWTGAGDSGDMGISPAGYSLLYPGHLFKIDSSSTNYLEYWISDVFLYAGVGKSGFEPTPYGTPKAPANVQIDGLKDGTLAAGTYDRDLVGQDHRDLRYFAFTYDKANVYFFFRRPANNTAQVSLYYFIDINVDGWMATGEPVIHLTFNNSGSSIEMGFYEAVGGNSLPNGYPLESYDPVKGNIMSALTSRPKTNNQSEWAEGKADGWSMPGKFKTFNNGVNPPTLGNVDGIVELFKSATLIDTHPDGTDAGYGVEFVVPWNYFRKYTAAGSAGAGLTYGNIFTWHVSLVGGQSGLSGAEDNAGGCCAGVGVSGAPDFFPPATTFIANPGPFNYRLGITYSNKKNYPTKFTTGGLKIINPKDGNGVDIPENTVKNWTVTGYRDSDCTQGNETNADSTHFNYVSRSVDGSDIIYTFGAYDFDKAGVVADATTDILDPKKACYYINIYAFGWPPLAEADLNFSYSAAFDIQSNTCDDIQEGSPSSFELHVLPVKMTYFNAVRSGQNVNLTWQTSTENNNSGFEIQRFIGAGGWQNIGFVSTQAANGNSGTALNYQFTDLNDTKGITQYRLKQVDKDNRAAYSLIRSVRGQGQKGKTIVYPNPSSDGKVSIVFEDVNGIRDIAVTDMSGRVIKQMKGITNNNVVIDNLVAGMYTVRIVNNETGEQEVQKFVVNKR